MIIGHEKIIEKLNKDVKNNNLMHSYIFSGINAIGKKLVAYNFSKMIMCKNSTDTEMFENDNHPDFKIISPDEKDSIKIEVIRQLIKDASIKPIQSEYKIYIIDDCDKMTVQAQNALLKTLEEPPSHVIFILITSKYFSLLDTIRSRSQKIDFEKLPNDDIVKYLKINNISIDVNKEIMLRLIDGSIGNINNVIQDFEKIQNVIKYIDNIENINIIKINEFSKMLIESKKDIFNLLEYMSNIFYYKLLKYNINQEKYVKCINHIEECKKNIEGNINFDICIDKLLINIEEEYNA